MTIEKFMGGEILSEEKYTMPHGSYLEGIIYNWKIPEGIPIVDIDFAKIGIFKYRNSWDWIYPVIEKIETISIKNVLNKKDYIFRVVPYKNSCFIQMRIIDDNDWYNHKVFVGKNKLVSTYECITDFLNWYENYDGRL